MKTNVHVWSYLAQLFLEWEMFRSNFIEKFKKKAFYDQKLFFENHFVFEVMWKKFVEPDKPQVKIWRTRLACWIIKATNTNLECVIISAFPQQRWLHERASILTYMYTACLATSRKPQKGRYICPDCTSVVNAHLKVHARTVSRLSQMNAEHTV